MSQFVLHKTSDLTEHCPQYSQIDMIIAIGFYRTSNHILIE